LWEICALQRPYEQVHTTEVLVKVAFLGNERPSLRNIVSPTIRQLLQKSWNPNPDVRPTMASIADSLYALFGSTDHKSTSTRSSPTALHKLMMRRKNSM
jgi:Protein tyrosine and serine/threonine kinase